MTGTNTMKANPGWGLRVALLGVAVATLAVTVLAICAPKLLAPAPLSAETATDPTRDVYMPPSSDIARDPETGASYAVDVLDVTVDADDNLALAQRVADSVGGRLVGSIPATGRYQIRLAEPKSLSELEDIAQSVEDGFDGVSAASPEALAMGTQANSTDAVDS